MDLHNKTNFGRLVHHLNTHNVTFDAKNLSALPTVIPNVPTSDLLDLVNRIGEVVETPDLQVMAKTWRKVESIAINVTITRLDCLKFDGLRSLELSNFSGFVSSTNLHAERAHALIKALRNAPSLEKPSFSDAALKIADLEELHATTTKLKQLKLMSIHIYTNGVVENQAPYQPAKGLESFLLEDVQPARPREEERILERSQPLDGAARDWILYIGQKYPLLRKLHLALDGQRVDIKILGVCSHKFDTSQDLFSQALFRLKKYT